MPTADPKAPMTYEESAALMTDNTFRGRIKVAVLKYAGFILEEPASTTAHNTRVKWGQQTFQNPDMSAQQIQPVVVMDPAIQTGGSAIDDAALQSAVEAAVNKMI